MQNQNVTHEFSGIDNVAMLRLRLRGWCLSAETLSSLSQFLDLNKSSSLGEMRLRVPITIILIQKQLLSTIITIINRPINKLLNEFSFLFIAGTYCYQRR